MEFWIIGVPCGHFCRYKYLAVYVPIVNFYYRGKVTYRFSAVESFRELLAQVSIMTSKSETIARIHNNCAHKCAFVNFRFHSTGSEPVSSRK